MGALRERLMSPPSAQDLVVLWVFATISSSLSYLGSFFLAYALLRVGLQDRADAMLLTLGVLGLLVSACQLFGRAFVPLPGEPMNFWCQAQANGIQFFGVTAIGWTAYMSCAMVLSLQPGHKPLTAAPSLRDVLIPLAAIGLVSFAFTLTLNMMTGYPLAHIAHWPCPTRPTWLLQSRGTLAVARCACWPVYRLLLTPSSLCSTGRYGDAMLWCWVADEDAGWQLGFYYLPLIFAWLLCLASIVCVRREVSRHTGSLPQAASQFI